MKGKGWRDERVKGERFLCGRDEMMSQHQLSRQRKDQRIIANQARSCLPLHVWKKHRAASLAKSRPPSVCQQESQTLAASPESGRERHAYTLRDFSSISWEYSELD